jgi:hypothetical protein
VLTAGDIAAHTDETPLFVADPFLFPATDGGWNMFVEVVFEERARGVLAVATSDDGRSWTYDREILDPGFHVSYPYVFTWDGEYYLTTEEGHADAKARLYRATEYPYEWTEETILYDPAEYGHGLTDHSLFRWRDKWWSVAGVDNEDIYVYYADRLTGRWHPHAENPVVTGRPSASRPAGRPIVRDDHILFFFQDVSDFYGSAVEAYRITDLSTSTYADERVAHSPILDGTVHPPEDAGSGWNDLRMHHYDPWYLGPEDGWLAAVDGDRGDETAWAIGVYHVPPTETEN